MKRRMTVILVIGLLSGCLNQPVGFKVSEPGGYIFTTGNQRDHYNYERYADGKLAVRITLRLVELQGDIYDPQFDAVGFLERIGWTNVIVDSEPSVDQVDDLAIIRFRVRDDNGSLITLWVLNLNTPYDVWAEVRGEASAIEQARKDWDLVWDSLEYLYF